MNPETKKLLDELRHTWESEFKTRLERGDRGTAEAKAAIDRVQDRMDEIEALSQKAALAPQYSNTTSAERKAHISWVRTGVDEAKVLRLADETQGGVLAPADFIAEVIKGVVQYSPIRSIAKVRQTSRTAIQFPKRTQTGAAVWTGDTQTRAETQSPRYGLDELPTHELYARVQVSNWDLEDLVVDLESEIRDDMAEQFGVSEGAGFVSGNSVGKPEGFLTNADVIANPILNGGATITNATADALIKLSFSIKEQYWPNAQFVLSRFTLRDVRILKDTAGNYLWQPAVDGVHGLATGLPSTIAGFPYTVATDMPTAASNALPVAFGDFSKGYMIADRIEIQTLRDPYSTQGNGVILHARKRVGGQVVVPEAINVLKMA